MKNILRKSVGLLLFTGAIISANFIFSQTVEVTKTATTAEGMVSEFGPQSIFIKTEPGLKPIRYVFSETTNYVNEEGKPVAYTTVKSGLPVTVYYTKVGDTLVASKVVVRNAAIVAAQALETSLVTTSGTISEFGPKTIIVRTETSPEPLRYSHSKTTTYVDEKGKPVAVETLKSGLPVTVHFTRVGETIVANKVIVRTSVVPPPAVIEEKKTTTTTTTETNK
ncbi:MAG: hypothetical protein RL693_1185 [Verrucomicrobiota bacterium]|jgi:hypothetical protein